jgi:hypothetical protein
MIQRSPTMSSCSQSRPRASRRLIFVPLAFIAGASAQVLAQQPSEADIAKQLNNPVAALISVPFQFNYDQDIGPGEEGERWLLNAQPVVPISLSEDWNAISRTIIPLMQLNDVPPGNDERGLGDITQSIFFSPKAPTASGWIWGAGPALLLKTASDDLLGTGKWGAGPISLVVRRSGRKRSETRLLG